MLKATHMLLERAFDPPLTRDAMLAGARRTGWCFELHKVTWNCSFLAAGGRQLICWFSAPDAESIRLALHEAAQDARVLWRGTVHEAQTPGVPNVLVERAFDAPVTFEEIQAIEEAGAWCLDIHHVRFVRTFFATNRQRMLCLYEAPDAEAVRAAQRQAGLPFAAAWRFERVGPEMLRQDHGQPC